MAATASRMVIKRNGEKLPFDSKKITSAISKAFANVYPTRADSENMSSAEQVTKAVLSTIDASGKAEIQVEEIQDMVEKAVMNADQKVGRAYILYRNKRAELRAFRSSLGIAHDDLKVPINTLIVMASRYLLKDPQGKITETPKMLFERVSRAIAASEKAYNKNDDEVRKIEAEFYDAMTSFKFMPNSPTLFNAGTKDGQLSACFVLPVGDSIPEIFDALKYAAMVHKTGGGTGFAFSRLRPAGDYVRSTSGISSGPVSFMKIFDSATEEIKQGGKRRGANMGILRIDHPDILDFIVLKESEGTLRNFNISAAVTDEFMSAVKDNRDYNLINPRTKKPSGKLNARAVWNLIVTMAWKTGDPGLVFIDRTNASYANPVPSYGPVESTNPCGEQPLYPYDSCNLGSINLAKMVKGKDGAYEIDWNELKRVTKLGVRFLDDVVDANSYPLPQIDHVSKAIRRIGLGVMGWADLLIKLRIRYDSEDALHLAGKVMSFITDMAREMSEELAVERGPFPEFQNSIWAATGHKPLRNSTVTTIAPTGTISIIAGGTSQGIEPIFSVVYLRNVRDSIGSNLIEANNEFEELALANGFYSEELMQKIANKQSIQDVEEVPEEIRKLFVTAFDIAPEWHVRMQAAFQKYTDNGVSKTVNFPSYATPQDIERAYMEAYDSGCKGITVYRDQSKSVQVLQTVKAESQIKGLDSLKHGKKTAAPQAAGASFSSMAPPIMIDSANGAPRGAKICPECGSAMTAGSGCFTCTKCSYSLCETA